MTTWVEAVLRAYGFTFLVVNGALFQPLRDWAVSKTPALQVGGVHMLKCRMCAGFWVSLWVSYVCDVPFWVVYGASYFLATQER